MIAARWPMIAALAGLFMAAPPALAAATATAGPPATSPAATPTSSGKIEPAAKALTRDDTLRLLQTKLDVDFEKTSLDNVIKYINKTVRDLNIVVDTNLRYASIDLSVFPVRAVKFKGIMAGPLLNLVLGDHLVAVPRNGYVLVTTKERAAWMRLNQAKAVLPPAPAEVPALAAMRLRLQEPVDLDFEKTSLDNVLKYIADVKHMKVDISPGLKAEKIDISTIVLDVNVKRVSVASALEIILDYQLAYEVREDEIMVIPNPELHAPAKKDVALTAADTERQLKQEIDLDFEKTSLDNVLKYINEVQPGLNLVTESFFVDAANIDMSKIMVAVKARRITVEAVLKQILGDDLVYVARPGYVVVTPKERGHMLVTPKERLEELDEEAESPAVKPAAEPPEAVARTLAMLKQPIDIDFEKTSLDNVLKYIGEITRGLNMVVDPDLPESGFDISTHVVDLKVKRVSIASVLDLILYGDVVYEAQAGYVLVTTKGKLRRLAEERKAAPKEPAAEPPETARTRAALQEPIDADFENMSLDKVLVRLGEVVKGVKVEVTPGAEVAGIGMSKRVVNMRVKRLPAATVLEIVLGSDLGYVVQPGRVVVIPRLNVR
jgi:hypothetical protein